jgi:hypothetical protein
MQQNYQLTINGQTYTAEHDMSFEPVEKYKIQHGNTGIPWKPIVPVSEIKTEYTWHGTNKPAILRQSAGNNIHIQLSFNTRGCFGKKKNTLFDNECNVYLTSVGTCTYEDTHKTGIKPGVYNISEMTDSLDMNIYFKYDVTNEMLIPITLTLKLKS